MWMVDKLHRGIEPQRGRIPAEILDPLLRWYTGTGTDADEGSAVDFVRAVKLHHYWLACDCLGEDVRPPLLSPVLLTEAETYYLRRLTGTGRPEHRANCPFHRDQADYVRDRSRAERLPLVAPTGYFSVLKPAAEHLAQRPEGEHRDCIARPDAPPLLAQLLWRLIEDAGTNVIEAIGDRPAPAITLEFQRLKAAATAIEIAPGCRLDQLLATHPDDIRQNRIYARLRKAAEAWRAGYEPQAFALLFASAVIENTIMFANGDPINVIGTIKQPPRKHVEHGPYLVIVAIGHHPAARGYAPVDAWAQPIYDGHHFLPVETDAERKLLKILLEQQWQLRDEGVLTRIQKPMFDIDPDLSPCRPAFLVASDNRATGEQRIQAIELGGTLDRPLAGIDLDQLTSTIADDAVAIDVAALATPETVAAELRSRHAAPLHPVKTGAAISVPY